MILNAALRVQRERKANRYCFWAMMVINQTIPLILCAEEDVEGNHGAAIGELDEETLLYFAARGIDKKHAEDIMTRAKLELLTHKIDDEETKEFAEEQLSEVLTDDSL